MLFDFLFPDHCLACEKIIPANTIVCPACLNLVKFYDPKDDYFAKKCRALLPAEHACALFYFEKDGISQKILHQLKYNSRESIGRELARWTAERLPVAESGANLIVTVPLHPKKLRTRGYNQLHLYADTLSKLLNIPCDHEVIRRNIHKPAQARQDKSHRAAAGNVFKLNKQVSGKHILLIDDVFTTGNTMASVAWEVLKSGNNKVSILVMAVD